jgi:ribulose-phosphate 3-epimerase
MTVVPGYGGQELLEGSYERIAKLRGLVECFVQADGGIHQDNVRKVNEAGADLIVVGTGIFEREDLPRSYRRLVQALA